MVVRLFLRASVSPKVPGSPLFPDHSIETVDNMTRGCVGDAFLLVTRAAAGLRSYAAVGAAWLHPLS